MPDERMPRLSAVSEIKDFFEIFLPGLFLLLHLALLLYCVAPKTLDGVQRWQSENLWGGVAAIGLPCGYVLGLALRLCRTSFADEVSGRFVRLTRGGTLLKKAHAWWEGAGPGGLRLEHSIETERMPYPGLMMYLVSKSLPPAALKFYKSTWLADTSGQTPQYAKVNLVRFTFFRSLVASLDDHAAKEMFSFEMRVRHAAHTCYALLLSGLILFVSAWFARNGALYAGAALEWGVLLFAFLPNVRMLRISEVELVFACCFRNRDRLERLISY